MKKLHKRVKKLDAWDITLIKLSVIAFTLFLITVWGGLMNLIHQVHWGWFLGAMVLLALRPWKRAYL